MIYLIPLIIILVCCYVYDYRQQTKGRLLWWILLMIILICISGFRYRLGIDSIQYEGLFIAQKHTLSQLTLDDFKDTRFAPIYVLIATTGKTIFDDFMIVQFMVSIIVNCVIFYFFWKNTPHIFLAALLYYFFQYVNLNMEVLREALAVSFFLMAWPFFKKGKWLAYYGFCILAFFCHISAIALFFVPIFWLPGIRWFFQFGARTWFIGGLILIGSFAVNYFFFDFIKLLAFTENMAERAEVYSKNDLGTSGLNPMGVVSELIKFSIYPILALYFFNQSLKLRGIPKDNAIQKLEFMVMIAIYVSLFSTGITIMKRYNNYFQFFSFIVMADWAFSYLNFQRKRIRLSFLSWIVIFIPLLFVSFYTFYLGDKNQSGSLKTYSVYYPYNSRFDGERDAQREKIIQYARRQ